MRKKIKQNNKGFSVLLIVVIISVVTLLLVKNSAFLSLGELELGFNYAKGQEALAIADGCMEDTLSQIRKDNNYGSSESMNVGTLNGQCEILITKNNDDRTIIVNGEKNGYNRTIEVQLTINNSSMIINSWQEKNN